MGRDLARVLWRWVKEVQGLGLVFRIQGTPSAPLAGPEAQACMLAGVNWVKLQCKVMRYEYLEDINAGKPAHTHTHTPTRNRVRHRVFAEKKRYETAVRDHQSVTGIS